MKLKPLFARVLLKRPRADKRGSIYIPETAQQRHATLRCEVLAKGPAVDSSINVGATVLIGQYAGAWLDEEGNQVPEGEFFICADEDILCEVSEDDERRATESKHAA